MGNGLPRPVRQLLIATAAMTTGVGAYVTGVAGIAWMSYGAWGWAGAFGSVFASLALTTGTLSLWLTLQRRAQALRHSGDVDRGGLESTSAPAPTDLVARFSQAITGAEHSRPFVLAGVFVMMLAAAAIGPVRLFRIALRVITIAYGMRSMDARERSAP